MSINADHDVQARTNPVFLTGKTAICLMAQAGIPHADEIVSVLKIHRDASVPVLDDPELALGNAVVVEAKYRTMCRLIEESGMKTNVDLPCGYTPKALHMTELGLRFVGLDLPIVVSEIGPILTSLSSRPELLSFHGVDATNSASLKEALQDVDGPICLSTEGMMMYFTENELEAVVNGIRELLQIHGGRWICADPEFVLQFYITFKTLLSEGAMEKLLATRKSAEGQSNVDRLSNSLILDPNNVEKSARWTEHFLSKHGLQVERRNVAEYMPELSIYRRLTQEQVSAFKQAMQRCHYWVITLKEAAKPSNEAVATYDRPFNMDHRLQDGTLKLSLQGRLDTISAPELLKLWEAKSAAHEIAEVTIDCSEMAYVSSAGLRVLLIMQKGCSGGVSLYGANPTVTEILVQTGMDSILRID